jgi:DNA-binding GntR family transcriptional regulator
VASKETRSLFPRRAVLSDETYEMIRDLIIDHEIPAGAKVNIEALSAQLNVSATPVREALARLESDGLIVKVALKGYTTTDLLTVKELNDLFQLRLLLEPWSAEQAAMHSSQIGKTAIKAELQSAKLALKLRDMDQVHALTEHDARFHELITEIAGNKSIIDSYHRTHCHVHLFRLYLATKNLEAASKGTKGFQKSLYDQIHATLSAPATIKEHELIGSAITEGNGKAARDAMNLHLKLSLKRYSTAARVFEK